MEVRVQARKILTQAGIKRPRDSESYLWESGRDIVFLIAFEDIRPPERKPDVYLLNIDRAESIVQGMLSGAEIPPIEVYPIVGRNTEFRYALFDGYHRYHLSIAAGFARIPALIVEDFFGRN
ncbi:ParB N-terminal domain-containing protein [Pseudomonas syringae]|uniref:ParB N-terminal domain-containing protein n=1 Tax=Pseudomonas syringae TaxID=317 RepID=UPI0003521E4A|nr:ParB N-terminal domain-containing protein [Pseudomonas syringae]EPF68299.1 Prophage PssSM-03, ParB-like nuclease domain protein [Pseudomonas syringae pv. syringae SM]